MSGTTGTRDLVELLPIALGLLAADGGQYEQLKQDLRRWAKEDPIDALAVTVLGGGIAFYLAERDTNPAAAVRAEAEAARAEAAEAAAVNRAILEKLDEIVRLLGEAKRA